jgi:REP element-mobilizing transposase RayT
MRKPRLSYTGALHHVIVRGNHNHPTFLDKADYSRYLRLLGEQLTERKIKIYSYCLMPNHVHLLLEQAGEFPLSKFMQRLQTAYTLYFNRKHGKPGHLFQGRYKGILVDKSTYLKELVRYIQLNPVRSKLVEKPGDYPWSGYSQYVGEVKDPPVRVETGLVLALFGTDPKQQRKAYRKYVLDALQEGHRRDYYEVRKGHILGGEEFERDAHARAGLALEPSLRMSHSMSELWKALLQREGHEGDPVGRRRSILREEAAFLATEACGISQKKVGDYFGLKQSGVSRAVKRLEKKWSEAPHLKEKVISWVKTLEKA